MKKQNDIIFTIEGVTFKIEPTEFEVETSFGEPQRVKLEGITKTLDSRELEVYNRYKKYMEEIMFTNNGIITGISYEKKDSYAKKYEMLGKGDEELDAIKKGLLNEDGTLTQEGKDLLLQVLLNDDDIRKRFFEAISLIEDEDGE